MLRTSIQTLYHTELLIRLVLVWNPTAADIFSILIVGSYQAGLSSIPSFLSLTQYHQFRHIFNWQSLVAWRQVPCAKWIGV
jgi:hypothetical protein